MIKLILFYLSKTTIRSKEIDIARGRYKLPENWKEIKRHLKFKAQE